MTLPALARQALAEEGWTRCWQKRDLETSVTMRCARRSVGYLNREAAGDYFWIHCADPGHAFGSAGEAKRAAARLLGVALPNKRANSDYTTNR
jgi:hypothetical protein